MVDRVILPTKEIARRYKGFEKLFNFYRGGLMAVIADFVLLEKNTFGMLTRRKGRTIRPTDEIIWKVIEAYEQSPEYINRLYSNPNDQDEYTITAALELIQEEVTNLLYSLFADLKFEILPTYQWTGQDLVITVRITEK